MNPADLKMVVGKGKVETLAAHVPGYALAVNASFFSPGTYVICSQVAQAGQLIAQVDGPYPYLAVRGGRAWFGRGIPKATDMDFAAGAGPMLLEGGMKAPVLPGERYGSDIVPGGETIKNHRMAVGKTPDGHLCFITLDGTFEDVRREMLAAGCADAMNLDGGGSAQWVERGTTIVGKDANGYIRPVVNALVAMKTIDQAVQPAKAPLLGGKLDGKLVIIDPGHGGTDPGAVAADGTHEAALALQISLQLRDILRSVGVDVAMTRESDINVTLENRVAIADRIGKGRDAWFISIHLNWASDKTAHGREVWAMPGGRAISLAGAVDGWLGALCGLADRYKPGAEPCAPGTRWYVCREGNAPSILVECGFISNPGELAQLKQPTFQQREAVAIATGLFDFWSGLQ